MAMDIDKVRLAVAMPHTDRSYMAEFTDSFFCLSRPMDSVFIRPSLCGPLDVLRNHLVSAALRQKCTHIWMADTDQVYPWDTLVRLLSHDLDAVAAKVHRRYPPYDPVLFRGKHPNFKNIPDEEWKKGGLIEVDATGAASILYNLEVFQNVEPPWFEFHLEDNGPPIGEDIFFCDKLRDAGYKIYVDCDIKVGHLATAVITEESYWAYKFARD